MKRLSSLLLVILAAACNDRALPTAHGVLPPIETIEIDPNPILLTEGDHVVVNVVSKDARGRNVAGTPPPVWSIGDTAVAVVSPAGRVVARATGATIVTARIADREAFASVVVSLKPAKSILVHPSHVRLSTDRDTVLHAVVQDSEGTVLSSQGVVWSSSAPEIAGVDNTGKVSPRQAGTVTITARRGSVAGQATVMVEWAKPVALSVSPTDTMLVIGETLRLTASALDAKGNVLDGIDLAWESSNPSVAIVSPEGVVRALSEGLAQIRVSTEGLEAFANIRVDEPTGIVIHSIEPVPLVQGRVAALTGVGFVPDVTANIVLVNDVAATVRHATETRIEFEVPDFGLPPCDDPRQATLLVRVNTADEVKVGQASTTVTATEPIVLEPGEAKILGNIECTALDTKGGTYILAVYNTSTAPSSFSAFRIEGNGGGPAVEPRPNVSSTSPDDSRLQRARIHGHILEQSREIAVRGYPKPLPRALGQQGPQRIPSVGDVVSVRIPRLTNLCSVYATVSARVAYVGTRAIVLEDPINPGAGQLDAIYQALGQEFDQVMWNILFTNFGDPLAYDGQLNGDGRLYMLFSNRVREQSDAIAGFVTSGDFVSSESCPASNEAEIFYAIAPASLSGAESWRRSIRPVIIHEAKHLVSYAERHRAGASLEERWLEESTAMIAEEIWARSIFGFTQFGNTTFEGSIACELRGGQPGPCANAPLVMLDHFYWLAQYYANVERLTPIAFPVDEDVSIYGSGWHFIRWTIDTSAASEATFLRDLTRSSQTGIANLTARSGRTFSELISSFALAIAGDDYPGGAAPRDPAHSIQSWNTRDVFTGLHDAFAGTTLAPVFPTRWPLAVRTATFGNFTVNVAALRAGTAMLLELSGPEFYQTLKFLSPSGSTTMPNTLGVAILRVR